MGIEILIGVFTITAAAAGLVFPVIGWALWSGRRQRLLLKGIDADDRFWVSSMQAGDAKTPVRFSVRGEGVEVALRAVVRGTAPLWLLDIRRGERTILPVVEADGLGRAPHFCLVEESWARAGASHPARKMTEIASPAGLAQRGYRLFADDKGTCRNLLAGGEVALYPLLVQGSAVREVWVTEDRVRLEVDREGLLAEDALIWVGRLVKFSRAVDGDDSRRLAVLPEVLATGVNGSSIGIPGMPVVS